MSVIIKFYTKDDWKFVTLTAGFAPEEFFGQNKPFLISKLSGYKQVVNFVLLLNDLYDLNPISYRMFFFILYILKQQQISQE